MQQVQRQFASGVTAQRSAQQLNTNIGDPKNTGLNEFIGALHQVANAAAPLINQEAQKKIALDKQEQLTRRWRNLAVSDDATKAGLAAYNLVDAQADFTKTGAEVNKWIEDQYRMGNPVTPEQIEEYRSQQYKALIERHPDVDDDQTISRFLTTQMMQNAPATIATEFKAQSEWQHSQKLKSIQTRVDQKIPEGTQAIIGSYKSMVATASAMGVSEAEVKAQFIETAKSYANTGDSRLLDALEDMPEFASEREQLYKLRQNSDKIQKQRDAYEIGETYAYAEADLLNGNISMEQFRAQAQGMQGRWGDTVITAAKIEDTITKYLKQKIQDRDKLELVQMALSDNGGVAIKYDSSISEEDKVKIPKAFEEYTQAGFNQQVQEGRMTKEQARVGILNAASDFSEKTKLKVGVIQSAVDGMMSLDPRSYEGENLPPDVDAGLQTLLKMKPSTLAMYTDEKSLGALEMYRLFSQTSSPKAAMIRVREMLDNPKQITDVKGTQLEVKKAVNETFDSEWFGTDVPKFQKEQLLGEGNKLAYSLMQSGIPEAKVAAKMAAQLMSAQKTQTFNGTYINASADELRKAGFTINDNVNEVEDAVELWAKNNMEYMKGQSYLEGLTDKDLRFEVHNGMFKVLDSTGQLVSKGARPVGELLQAYRPEKEKRLLAEIEKNKVDPNPELFDKLIPAMVFTESTGRQHAVSPAGAIGVMQVMPDTAPEAAAMAGLPWNEKKYKTDAEYNKKLGTAYMKYQLRRYKNDLPMALTAYNWGQGNLDHSRRILRSKGLPVTLENIFEHGRSTKGKPVPKETKEYAAKVINRMGGKNGKVFRTRFG